MGDRLMPVKIKSTSGSVTLDAQNVSGDQTLTVPSIAGGKTLLTTDGDGSSLTGLSTFDPDGAVVINESGVDVDFRVESSGEANALFVNGGNNRVGIGTSSTEAPLHIKKFADTNIIETLLVLDCDKDSHRNGKGGSIVFQETSAYANTAEIAASRVGGGNAGLLDFKVRNTSILQLKSDGRGLSQFTAKAWVNFNGSGTLSVRDSHGVSSVSDLGGTGQYQVNFSNNMANTNYSAVTGGIKGSYGAGNRINDMTTSKFAIDNWSTSGYLDATIVTAIVFGD